MITVAMHDFRQLYFMEAPDMQKKGGERGQKFELDS